MCSKSGEIVSIHRASERDFLRGIVIVLLRKYRLMSVQVCRESFITKIPFLSSVYYAVANDEDYHDLPTAECIHNALHSIPDKNKYNSTEDYLKDLRWEEQPILENGSFSGEMIVHSAFARHLTVKWNELPRREAPWVWSCRSLEDGVWSMCLNGLCRSFEP